MVLPTRRRPTLLAVLLAGVLAAGLTATGSTVPAHAANGTLSGTVTESGTGAPIGNVTVEAFCWQVTGTTPGDICGTTTTAADGTYSMSLAPGQYKISYDDWPEHARQFHGGGSDIGDVASTPVSVPSGGAVAGINATLQPLRTVSGTVTAAGTPVGGINVTAYQLSVGPAPSWTAGEVAVTEPDGSYALHLEEGTYRIGFADAVGPHQTVFYDGATTVDGADDVVVAGDVADIDADLPLNHAITGTATVDGINMPAVNVTAFQANPSAPGGWEAVKVTATVDDGSYALYLPDGTYRIEFKTWQGRFPTVYYPLADNIDLATDVVVAGAEVPNIDATIVSGPDDTGPAIRGTATTADGGAPAAGVDVTAYRFDVTFGSWVAVKLRSTGPDGSYALHVPEGTYRVGFSSGINRYQTVYYGGSDTVEGAADVEQITAGVTGIDAEVVENGSISGVVTAEPLPDLPPGAPPSIVTAWRWEESVSEWLELSETGSGPDGRYELYLPDGTYRIQFRTFVFGYQPLFYDGTDSIGEATDVVMDGADVTGIDGHLIAVDDRPPPTWSNPSTLSGAGQDAWDPRVAVDPHGVTLAVWSDQGSSRVQASARRKRGGWSQPVFLSPAGQEAVDPRLAIGADGTHVVVWRRWDGSNYRVEATTRSSTGDWSPPTTLSGPGADAWDPQVAVGRARSAVVVWSTSDSNGSAVQASVLGAGSRWSAPKTLSDGRDAWDPQVAVAADGTGTVVWSRSGPVHVQVQAIRLSRTGAWSSRTNLSAPSRDAEDPDVAAAPRGVAAVVWRTSSGPDERIQAVRRGSTGPWSKPATLSAADRDAHDPQVAMDPAGTTTVVWSRWDGSTDRVQASSRTPGKRWSAPETLSAAGLDGTDPQVAAGPDGRATAVWRQSLGDGESVVAAIRMRRWSSPTVLTNSFWPIAHPQVATGANGTVAAVWERRIEGNDRVEGAVRFDPGGSDHCRNVFGVDINVVFGYSEQIVDGPCRTIDAGSRWRPLTLWLMNTAFEQVPPGYVPAGETPLEDLVAKLESVSVEIDPGTSANRTLVFPAAHAVRTDLTFVDYAPGTGNPLVMAASAPRVKGLAPGKHTISMTWTLDAQHCDGSGVVEAESCLPSGDVRMWTRVIKVRRSRR